MLENPYKPPAIPLNETQSVETAPRKHFRFRVIPATLCFTFGGVGVAAWVFQAVVIAAFMLRLGPARFNFGVMAIILAGQLICYSLSLVDGWLWLRGRWFRALAVLAAAYGIGVAVDLSTRAAYDGTGPARGYMNRFIKPASPAAMRKTVHARFRQVNFWSMINLQ
jgi:hypothetical protein